jgi:hypothetical protein
MWAFLAFIPATASAEFVYAPHPGTVTATTYTSSGAFHGAVDISSGICNQWGVQSPFMGSVYWNVTVRSTNLVCYGSDGGGYSPNEAERTLPDGWRFRFWHFIRTSDSYDRTCARCTLGNEGATGNTSGVPLTHLQLNNLGTMDTSWYSGYTTKGEAIDADEIIGVL